MKIGSLSNHTPEPSGAPVNRPPAGPARPESVADRLELSAEARARLGELADRELRQPAATEETGRTESEETKLDKVRRRIENGFYDSSGARSLIAKRLVDDIEL